VSEARFQTRSAAPWGRDSRLTTVSSEAGRDLRSRLSAATTRVALITVNAVVHIPIYIRVAEVVGIVAAMTGRALEYRVVVRIRMTRGANAVGVAMVNRELRVLRVIERRPRPGGRGVASRAGGREERRLRGVAGIRGVVVVGLMAADTGCGQRGVVAVDVAVSACPGRHGM
jgi:hypothetical protein